MSVRTSVIMATINFYLDSKLRKEGYAPIELRINIKGVQIKVSTCIKVKPTDFDKDKQLVLSTDPDFERKNRNLTLLKNQSEDYLNNPYVRQYRLDELKTKIRDIVNSYHNDENITIIEDAQCKLNGKKFTFIDLFAGAGGFSEGFLQAEIGNKYFDFILANDINENCELTHIVRYNHQLGLKSKFLKKDISEPDFLNKLIAELGGEVIDVICGGPPCQSFSLAGKRKKYDKKDDLFSHYIKVIRYLRPKYFIMENVKGILTKESGKIQQLILNRIRSIIDNEKLPSLYQFITNIKERDIENHAVYDALEARFKYEEALDEEAKISKEQYIGTIVKKFKKLTPQIVDYKTSKTDPHIATIRHGLNLLANNEELAKIQNSIIKAKDAAYLDNDQFVDVFNRFIGELDPESIVAKIENAIRNLNLKNRFTKNVLEINQVLKIYNYSIDDCLSYLQKRAAIFSLSGEFEKLQEDLRLYKIDNPIVVNASDFGVPQNRERVLFIGCRKDQEMVKTIEPTVREDEKVSVFEALYDLDFIGNNEHKHDYIDLDMRARYNGKWEDYAKLIRRREIDGKPNNELGKTYSEWSKLGRLTHRIGKFETFYTKSISDLEKNKKTYGILHNHQTSNQNSEVIRRLEIILKNGAYDKAKTELKQYSLDSNKRNYNVLKPDSISPTIMTMPDDYIHFSSPRAITVREMARLQSFDDSFVFQGKRSTGGEKRKEEIPQFTLVGNAVPPLLARAVAMKILKIIK